MTQHKPSGPSLPPGHPLLRFQTGCFTVMLTLVFILPVSVVAVLYALRRFPAFIVPAGGGEFRFTTLGAWTALVLCLLPSVLFLWWRRTRARSSSPARPREAGPAGSLEPARPARPPTGVGEVLLRVWGGAFFVIGLSMIGVAGYSAATRLAPSWREARESRQWPNVEGVIIRSELESRERRDGRIAVRPRIQYEYTAAGGTRYLGSRLYFGADTAWRDPARSRRRSDAEGRLAQLQAAQATLGQYPLGKRVRVTYDPKNPANAALNPGLNLGLLPGPAVIVLGIVIGAGVAWVGWKLIKGQTG